MRSEDGFTVWDAGEPGEAGAAAVGSVVLTESTPYVGILEGVGWATAVAAAGASADLVPTSVGMAKTEARSLSAASKAARGRGSDQRWRRMQKCRQSSYCLLYTSPSPRDRG